MKKLLITLTCLLGLSSFLADARRRDKCCPKRCPKKVCCPKKACCPKPRCPKRCPERCPKKSCITTCVKTCCDTKESFTKSKCVPVDVVKFREEVYEEPEYTTETRLRPVNFTVTRMVEDEVPVTRMVKKTRLVPVVEQLEQTVCVSSEKLGRPCCEERPVTRCTKKLPTCR